jgi:hypothetical protein
MVKTGGSVPSANILVHICVDDRYSFIIFSQPAFRKALVSAGITAVTSLMLRLMTKQCMIYISIGHWKLSALKDNLRIGL